MLFAILKNEFDDNHEYWIKACHKLGQDFHVIDMLDSTWLNQISSHPFDCYLACPSGRESLYKKMYDERIYIIDKILKKIVYPSYNEISIHENKKYLSYWLYANSLPCPNTYVFYNLKEALTFSEKCKLPIIGKINIGASGKGVKVFRQRKVLINYIETAFNSGLRQEWGPNLHMGAYKSRIINILKNPKLILKKLAIYKKVFNELQKGFVILQDYIPHNFEWRIVRIGDSYFGHQKVKQGDKASGTKGIEYIAPPTQLLDFVKNICEKYSFNSMAIDLFEDGKGGFLINEMQCIFGHVQAYICEKDGQPGRFVFKENGWLFEPGLFNDNLSYDLRLNNVLSIMRKSNR